MRTAVLVLVAGLTLHGVCGVLIVAGAAVGACGVTERAHFDGGGHSYKVCNRTKPS